MYTRRQPQVKLRDGVSHRKYYEAHPLRKTERNADGQEISTARATRAVGNARGAASSASNYFPGFDKHRLEVDAEVDLRITRGVVAQSRASASRIRDQLSLPRRNASPGRSAARAARVAKRIRSDSTSASSTASVSLSRHREPAVRAMTAPAISHQAIGEDPSQDRAT